MRSALEEVDGVDEVEVLFEENQAYVVATDDLEEVSLVTAVEEAGFGAEVRSVEG